MESGQKIDVSCYVIKLDFLTVIPPLKKAFQRTCSTSVVFAFDAIDVVLTHDRDTDSSSAFIHLLLLLAI